MKVNWSMIIMLNFQKKDLYQNCRTHSIDSQKENKFFYGLASNFKALQIAFLTLTK